MHQPKFPNYPQSNAHPCKEEVPDLAIAPAPPSSPPLTASMTILDAATCEQMIGGYRYGFRDRPRAYYATPYHYTYYRIANPAYLLG